MIFGGDNFTVLRHNLADDVIGRLRSIWFSTHPDKHLKLIRTLRRNING
jgi:hypothetical protein